MIIKEAPKELIRHCQDPIRVNNVHLRSCNFSCTCWYWPLLSYLRTKYFDFYLQFRPVYAKQLNK